MGHPELGLGGDGVVAELLGAEAGGLATAALGQDVAALEAEWFCGGHWWGPPPPVCCASSSKEKTYAWFSVCIWMWRVKRRSPRRGAEGFLYLYFYCSRVGWVSTPNLFGV
jgi:hypothetical protein